MSLTQLSRATDKLISELNPEELGRYVAELTDQYGKDITSGRMTRDAATWEMNLLFEKRLKYMPAGDYIKFLLAQNAATTKILMKVIGEKDLEIMDLKMSLIELAITRIACTERILSVMNFSSLDHTEADAKREECIQEAREDMKPFVDRLTALRMEYEEYAADGVWAEIGKAPEHAKRDSLLTEEIVEKYGIPHT